MVTELNFSKESMVCVRPSTNEFGVVGIDRKGFVCYSCDNGCHSCIHVDVINTYIDGQIEECPDFLLAMVRQHESLKRIHPKTYTRYAVSVKAIPQSPIASQKCIFNGSFADTFDEDRKLIPDFSSDTCSVCASDMHQTVEWSQEPRLLFASKIVIAVQGKVVSFAFL